MLSELAPAALTGPSLSKEVHSHHGFVPLPHGGAVVINAMIDGLREEDHEGVGHCSTSMCCSLEHVPPWRGHRSMGLRPWARAVARCHLVTRAEPGVLVAVVLREDAVRNCDTVSSR